jgi:curved DNA-binding protein CbpA
MKTVYDLIGVRPDADAEAVKKAFRAAAKLHHPDHNPNDPDAPFRFRRITAANAILRDPKRRAAYDQRLTLRRQRIRSKWTRIIISEAIYVTVFSIVLVMGYIWIKPNSSTSVRTDKVETDTARGPTEMAAVQPAARSDATGRDGLRDKFEVIPERAIEPSVAGPATDDTAITKHGTARRPLPNALGLQPDDARFYVESRRNRPPDRLGQVPGHR